MNVWYNLKMYGCCCLAVGETIKIPLSKRKPLPQHPAVPSPPSGQGLLTGDGSWSLTFGWADCFLFEGFAQTARRITPRFPLLTPNDTPPASPPRTDTSSTALFFSYRAPEDRSGASVAGRRRSDLCATSGANIYGGSRTDYGQHMWMRDNRGSL